MFRRSLVGLAAVALLAACSDSRDAISPRPTPPALGISDGAHSGGNQDFFFLPPVAANPSNHPFFEAGRFNAKLSPTVTICKLNSDADACETEVKTFPAAEVSVADQQYKVNWDTKSTPLTLSRMYRISVNVGSETVGYVDVDPVSNGSQLRNVNTDEYIGLVDGRTLPIKFRIEKGATCENRNDCAEQTVTNQGAVVTTESEFAGVDFPANWLPINPRTQKPYENVVVKIERVAVGIDNRCHSGIQLLQFEGCYEFRTDPDVGVFAQPVVAGICPELSPSDPLYSSLDFYTSGEGEQTREAPEADAPFLDCEGFTGTPAIGATNSLSRGLYAFASGVGRFLSPKPLYAIDLGWGGELLEFSRGGYAVQAHIEELTGDDQIGEPGATLPTQLSVEVHGHHGRPVKGFPITFTPSAGTLSKTNPVLTDANGIASVTWTLGSTPGAQQVTVEGPIDEEPTTFYATVRPAVASVTLQTARIDLGQQQTSAQVVMVQRDAAGNVIESPHPCTWAVTSNLGNLQISQTGVVSTTMADDGAVTANCNGVIGGALVEAGDYQFTASGSAIDAAGDQVPGGAEGAPDLIGISASVAQRNVTFHLDFAPASVAGVSIHSGLSIDTDQSFATGHPGLSSAGTMDNTIIGVDYLLRIDNGSAVLLEYNGTPNSFSTVMSVTCAISATPLVHRISCTVPLKALDYDNGYLNFKATSGANYPTGGNNGIRDVITNVGQAPATTSPPIIL